MNQDKLEVVKQEMARVNIDILGISELRWTGMGVGGQFKNWVGTSPAVQWLRIEPQGMQVQSLVREDPTCLGATEPLCHSY